MLIVARILRLRAFSPAALVCSKQTEYCCESTLSTGPWKDSDRLNHHKLGRFEAMKGWHWALGLLLVCATGLGVSSCTTPPIFSDSTNNFITFNPVFLDSLPGTSRAMQVRGQYVDGDVVLFVTRAEFDALPRLWCYQLWAVNRSGGMITDMISTPKWLWDPTRHVAVQPDGNIIEPRKFNFQTDITEFDEILLSIEPYPDFFVVLPSGQDTLATKAIDSVGYRSPDLEFMSAGPLSSGKSNYTLRFEMAEHYDTDTGLYFLANFTGDIGTPTLIENVANYGVWFGYKPIGLGLAPSLSLPPPPANWVYEGWILPAAPNPPIPISTGRFTSMTDRDLSDRYSGGLSSAHTLMMPGEDFLTNRPDVAWTFPLNLVSPIGDTGWVFITLEPNFQVFAGIDPQNPSPDIDAGPFFYRLLQSPLPDSAHIPALNSFVPDSNKFLMQNMHGKFPKFGHPGAPLIEVTLSSQ